jgi:hypothetical protein
MFLELLIFIYIGVNAFTEVKELYTERLAYFSDAWNYFDIINICLYAVAAVTWAALMIIASLITIPNKFNMKDASSRIQLFDTMQVGVDR